jgi:nucleotide-binding universal stress UspA family protein
MELRRLLVAVDSSVAAAQAFEVGHAIARRCGMELAVVHVVDPGMSRVAGDVVTLDAADAATSDEARALVAGFRTRTASPTSLVEIVRTGKPATVIVAAAHEWSADLIVVGARSHSLLHHALMGSVASGVLHDARCPVLVVPTSH